MIKLLRVEYQNIKLFKEGLIFDLTALDRIVDKNQVYIVSPAINLQKVIALTGINATGKTTVLKLVQFATGLLSDNTYLSNERDEYSLFEENSKIVIDFILDDTIYRLESVIGIKKNSNNTLNHEKRFYYKKETILVKKSTSVKLKKDLFNWSEYVQKIERESLDKGLLELLQDNQSIIVMKTKDIPCLSLSIFDFQSFKSLIRELPINLAFVNLFDDSIETLEYKTNGSMNIKYKGNEQTLIIKDIDNIDGLLSSGTLKGILLLNSISFVLKRGGFLIVDEIADHLNKTLVQQIINLFMDRDINKQGAILIFSTHYLELLDDVERKDAIYVLNRDAEYNIHFSRFSSRIRRNDIKKSEVLVSNYFGGTAPKYELIQRVIKLLKKEMN